MELLVVLPDGQTTTHIVNPSCPMMDLLIQISSKENLRPSAYVIEALDAKWDDQDLDNKPTLKYNSNTPIETLSTQVIRLVPKNPAKVTTKNNVSKLNHCNSFSNRVDNFNKMSGTSVVQICNDPNGFSNLSRSTQLIKSKSNYITSTLPPQVSGDWKGSSNFLNTFRLQVHLPQEQFHVIRASPEYTVQDILDIVQEERSLKLERYRVTKTNDAGLALDFTRTIKEYNITELTFELLPEYQRVPEVSLKKKIKKGHGFGSSLKSFFRHLKPSSSRPSSAPSSRRASSMIDLSNSHTMPRPKTEYLPPPSTHQSLDIQAALEERNTSKPKPPPRKRGHAPPPPGPAQQESRVAYTGLPAARTLSESSYESDSERSSVPATLPRRCKLAPESASTNNLSALSPPPQPALRRGVSDMALHQPKLATRNKRAAPRPPSLPPLTLQRPDTEELAAIEEDIPPADRQPDITNKETTSQSENVVTCSAIHDATHHITPADSGLAVNSTHNDITETLKDITVHTKKYVDSKVIEEVIGSGNSHDIISDTDIDQNKNDKLFTEIIQKDVENITNITHKSKTDLNVTKIKEDYTTEPIVESDSYKVSGHRIDQEYNNNENEFTHTPNIETEDKYKAIGVSQSGNNTFESANVHSISHKTVNTSSIPQAKNAPTLKANDAMGSDNVTKVNEQNLTHTVVIHHESDQKASVVPNSTLKRITDEATFNSHSTIKSNASNHLVHPFLAPVVPSQPHKQVAASTKTDKPNSSSKHSPSHSSDSTTSSDCSKPTAEQLLKQIQIIQSKSKVKRADENNSKIQMEIFPAPKTKPQTSIQDNFHNDVVESSHSYSRKPLFKMASWADRNQQTNYENDVNRECVVPRKSSVIENDQVIERRTSLKNNLPTVVEAIKKSDFPLKTNSYNGQENGVSIVGAQYKQAYDLPKKSSSFKLNMGDINIVLPTINPYLYNKSNNNGTAILDTKAVTKTETEKKRPSWELVTEVQSKFEQSKLENKEPSDFHDEGYVDKSPEESDSEVATPIKLPAGKTPYITNMSPLRYFRLSAWNDTKKFSTQEDGRSKLDEPVDPPLVTCELDEVGVVRAAST